MKFPKGLLFLMIITVVICLVITTNGISNSNDETIKVIGDEVNEIEKIMRNPVSLDIVSLDDSDKQADSLSEILSERVGVQIKRYGGPGSYSNVSIRGSNSNQVMIYLNGVPINDSVFGEVNLENLPLNSLERIEIYRGVSPVRFGITGIGGVINLVTKKTKNSIENQISTSYGSHNTLKLSLSRMQRFDKFSYIFFVNRTSSDGDFKFRDDNGTPVVNTLDDRWVKRENNNHTSYSATGRMGYKAENLELALTNDFFCKEQGLAGMGNNNTQHASFNTKRNILNMKAKIPRFFSKYTNAGLNLFYAMRKDKYEDSHNEIGLLGQSKTGVFDAFGGTLNTEITVPEIYQTFTLYISPQRETYYDKESISEIGEVENPKQKRDRINFAIEDECSLFNDRLQIVPQLRYDVWRDDFYIEKSPYVSGDGQRDKKTDDWLYWQTGVRLYIYKRSFFIKGNMGKSSRLPAFTELFGDRGTILGNPNLKPEKSWNRDVGVGINIKKITDYVRRFRFEYIYFSNSIDDIIIFIHNSQSTMIAHNISGAKITGHEISISASIFDHFKIAGNYTYQNAIDKSKIPYYRENYLPHRPMHEASANIKAYNDYAAIIYEFNLTGANFRDRASSDFYYLKRRKFHNLTLQVFPMEGLTFFMEVKNLTDEMKRDVIGYPLPGRSYYGGMSHKF